MDSQLIALVIGSIATVGGMAIAAVAITVSVPWSMKEKMARLEARTKERLALIEKGVDPAQIFKEKKSAANDPIFWGFLCVGVGFGILVGYILAWAVGWDPRVLINALGVLLGGVGLVRYKRYSRRHDDQRRS